MFWKLDFADREIQSEREKAEETTKWKMKDTDSSKPKIERDITMSLELTEV